jgi:hypothetical protein
MVTRVEPFLKMVSHSFIHTYFSSANHCSHIALKLYDWFLPVVHLQLTQILSLHPLWC